MTLDLNSLSKEQLELLNKVSVNIMDDYNLLIEEIYAKSNKKIGWLVNSLLSRNPYMSDLFINMLNVVFVKEVVEKNREINHVILTDDTLYHTLNEFFERNNIKVEVSYSKKSTSYYGKGFKGLVKNIYYSFILLADKLVHGSNCNIEGNNIRLIDIFWDASMFDDDTYSDKYYGRLWDFFSSSEQKLLYHLPHVVKIKELAFLRTRSKAMGLNVIFKHDYLKVADFVYALAMPFRLKFDGNLEFRGINVERIINRDFISNIFNTSSFYGLLNYRFVMRLKRQFPGNIKLFVSWFENQVIDRGLNKGFNDYYKDVDTKGYQGFVVSHDFNAYLCPTRLEMQQGLLPKSIYLCGTSLENSVRRFNKDLHVKTIAAFRFEHLWKSERNVSIGLYPQKTILVILPFVYYESVKIIHRIIEIVSKKAMNNLIFHLKLHPDLNKDKLLSRVNPLPDNMVFESRGINESFSNATLVIGNTSSACVEALAYGIPVIILGDRYGLTQNPIPFETDSFMWRLVFSSTDLSEAVLHFIDKQKTEQRKLLEAGDRIKQNCFEPLNRDSIRAFLAFEEI